MMRVDPPDDIDGLDGLLDYLQDLHAEVERLDNLVVKALENSREASDDVAEVREYVNELDDHLELVEGTMPDQQRGKLEKINAILTYATTHASGGTAGVKVDTGEATAAAGSSRDTARRLMDEIGATFPWAEVDTPGGPKPKQLKLRVRDRDLSDLLADVRDHYSTAEEESV